IGVIVETHQNINRRISNGVRTITSLQANVIFDDRTMNSNADLARKYRKMIQWGSVGSPVSLGTLGVIMVFASVASARKAGRQ
uniref:hypothetical protein n=1 Tax=Klebsiella pneumoniae TaxID=573 RepID=UPI0025A25352